jgi:DNA helicase IV
LIDLDDPDEPMTDGSSADELLAGLGQDRAGAGPDIVAKIRADQDRLVGAPAETLLVIEGGPGTGKTMTALHRVARLIDDGEVTAAEVLVVGPSAAFARYTRDTLTSWGHDKVEHRAIDGLLPTVAAGLDEAPYVTRLKGEARMAGLLSRALAQRQARQPELPSTIAVRGRAVPLDPQALRHVVSTARASEASPGDRRRILRAVLAAGSEDPRLVLAAVDVLADLLWPQIGPADFLRDLFGSRERLAAAGGGEFTEREISALHRVPAESAADEVWSEADLPLLDEADHLLNGDPRAYAHVVVDEAQDLSPMQARAVSRRSATGSMTIVGDMAQSTGPWARDDWYDLLAHLPSAMPHIHRELRFGYRVPRQIFELAAELLPSAAPSVQAPTTVRDGPAEPAIIPVDAADRSAVVLKVAMEHVAAGRSVAIICPPRCRNEIEVRPGITLLTPHEAKGLEFDAAIVVEPGLIVDEDPRGHRLLYIALTRATGHLHLIGAAEDLPADFTEPPAPTAVFSEPSFDRAVRESIDIVAHALAEALLANLAPELWPAALERLVQLIAPDVES